MRILILLPILIVTLTAKAQQLVLNDGLIAQYTQEAILPLTDEIYALVKDSTAFLYNVNGAVPYKASKLKDSYILNTVENKLYNIKLVPNFVDQIEDDTQELITLVTYVYEVNYATVDKAKTNDLVKQYGYLIPKKAVSETFRFNETLNIEDSYSMSIYQDKHLSLPSHYIRIDKNNILALHANGDLVLNEVKEHKVTREKKWSDFNGSINIVSSVKIGDVARINFQHYQENSDTVVSIWSTINLKTQAFVPVDLKDFNTNLENLQAQDVALLNSVPYFYKAINASNMRLFVLPDRNFVWLDDESYYYGSDDLSKYVTMNMEGKSYDLSAHAYIFNYPSRIIRAIAPQEIDKIRILEEVYVKNKHKIESERCKN
ncbi:hypothetical protein [Bizionia arctica]|uniref:Uncharacterized protein n=1 Tax=Bizionia arctica TaxID=1495645 RepID=A0A917LMJ3_9FLAO|nr:hypothetical protein [Bizionia arctica]GGG45024.1 hypothetical protein GCM10010976_15780 [Bizionia arctica]